MSKQLLKQEVLEILGIDELSESDQLDFLSREGDEIFAAAVERFEGLISGPELHRVQHFLASDPEPEEVINYLVSEFATFSKVLQSVSREFNEQ